MSEILVEKYKPKTFDNMIYHQNIVTILKNNIKNLPHIVLHGPSGIGKTTLIRILVNTIYKETEIVKQNLLILSACNHRGIDIVRKNIKEFAQQSIYSTHKYNLEYSSIILLRADCDSMSMESQSALRRIMEEYSKSTRFIFICNHLSNITDPILSRCIKLSFKLIPPNKMIKYLKMICKKEKYSRAIQNSVTQICKIGSGDLRKTLNLLQIVSTMGKNRNIIKENLKYLEEQFDEEKGLILLKTFKSNNFYNLRDNIKKNLHDGYSPNSINNKLFELIIKDSEIDYVKKNDILSELSNIDHRLCTGGNGYLNILSLYNIF